MRNKRYGILAGLVGLIGAGLLYYSQTAAYAWDEGFHLLTAQLILRGKLPYVDFIFPQSPLNAYWNAMWMALFGETWRVAHAVAALCVTAAVFLMADYVWRNAKAPQWQLPCALMTSIAFGLNPMVFEFGPVGQAYGFCLLSMVAAFRVGVRAVESRNFWWPFCAGLLSSAAANSSLLTAPVFPILLLWLMLSSKSGRLAKFCAFAAGGVIASAPLLNLLARAPRNALFCVFEFHGRYRQVKWDAAVDQNLAIVTSWIDSSPALLLFVLAIAGMVYVRNVSLSEDAEGDGECRQRRELYLCFFLAAGLATFISTAIPTFARYYLFLVPFMSVLAATGIYFLAMRMGNVDRPSAPVLLAVLLLVLGFGKKLFEGREAVDWSDMEVMTRLAERVTPKDGKLYADEQFYFLDRRIPPEGMESEDSHKLEFAEARAKSLHQASQSQLDNRIKAGEFDTVAMTNDEDRIRKLDLHRLYRQSALFNANDYCVFWDRIPPRVKKATK